GVCGAHGTLLAPDGRAARTPDRLRASKASRLVATKGAPNVDCARRLLEPGAHEQARHVFRMGSSRPCPRARQQGEPRNPPFEAGAGAALSRRGRSAAERARQGPPGGVPLVVVLDSPSSGEHGSASEEAFIFVSDASAEAERLTASLRSRGYLVADVPLGLLV